MKLLLKIAGLVLPVATAGIWCTPAQAQSPATVVPIVVDTAVPIIVNTVKPKPSGLTKFEGFVMNANTAHAPGGDCQESQRTALEIRRTRLARGQA